MDVLFCCFFMKQPHTTTHYQMVKSISKDRRNQIIGMVAARIPIKEVAQCFGVHRNTVSKLVGLHRRTGNVLEHPRSMRKRCFLSLMHMVATPDINNVFFKINNYTDFLFLFVLCFDTDTHDRLTGERKSNHYFVKTVI